MLVSDRSDVHFHAWSTCAWYRANVASLSFCIVCVWAKTVRSCGTAEYPLLGALRGLCVMSAIGPKQTSARALHMSAFGGKADMTLCGRPLLRSLLGVKRTCRLALHN